MVNRGRIRSCVMTIWVTSVLGRIRQACHYESLVIGDVIEKFVLIVKG